MSGRGARRALRAGAVAVSLLIVGPGVAGRGAAEPLATRPQRIHEVKAGETLGAIARRYGVSVASIVRANRLSSARVILKIGRRLTIPARAAAAGPARRARPPERASSASSSPRAPGGYVLGVPDFPDGAPLFAWPVEGPVTSAFGRRRSGWHPGIDIKADRGTPVLAAAAGAVVTSGVEPRYGRVVKIEHEGGFVTVYAHNDRNLVEVGDRVAPGDTIATIGRTGRASTFHLHFEVRRDGQLLNPLYLLPLPPLIARVDLADGEDD